MFIVCLSLLVAAPPAADINLSAFAHGALVESSSSDYDQGWQARWLSDESPGRGWSSVKGAQGPFEIVISLAARSELHAIELDTASTENPARATKEVELSISDSSAKTGFKPIIAVSLESGADKQSFKLKKAAQGRFIKLTIKSNHGDPDYSQLMELRVYGKSLDKGAALPSNLSGSYHSERYGTFHLLQDGATLVGCYEHKEGLVQGGAESNLMRLTWREGERTGPAIMVLARDGKSFEGWWADKDTDNWHANWDLKKVSDQVGSCPHWNPKAASGNVVATELAAEGRVRLYGINFDLDSDHLRADAKPAVEQLTAALKANPTWKVSIEGHTDSTGKAPHNLELSQLRANAVKAAMVAAGIEAERLSTTGLGQSKPIASNDSEVGRAQNRRVEVVRQ